MDLEEIGQQVLIEMKKGLASWELPYKSKRDDLKQVSLHSVGMKVNPLRQNLYKDVEKCEQQLKEIESDLNFNLEDQIKEITSDLEKLLKRLKIQDVIKQTGLQKNQMYKQLKLTEFECKALKGRLKAMSEEVDGQFKENIIKQIFRIEENLRKFKEQSKDDIDEDKYPKKVNLWDLTQFCSYFMKSFIDAEQSQNQLKSDEGNAPLKTQNTQQIKETLKQVKEQEEEVKETQSSKINQQNSVSLQEILQQDEGLKQIVPSTREETKQRSSLISRTQSQSSFSSFTTLGTLPDLRAQYLFKIIMSKGPVYVYDLYLKQKESFLAYYPFPEGIASIQLGSYLYLAGGEKSRQFYRVSYVGKYKTLRNMPTAKAYFPMVYWPTFKMVITIGGSNLKQVTGFSHLGNDWRRLTDLPKRMTGSAACLLNNVIYNFGGHFWNDSQNQDLILRMNLPALIKKWQILSYIISFNPNKRVSVISNKIILFCKGAVFQNDTFLLEPQQNSIDLKLVYSTNLGFNPEFEQISTNGEQLFTLSKSNRKNVFTFNLDTMEWREFM